MRIPLEPNFITMRLSTSARYTVPWRSTITLETWPSEAFTARLPSPAKTYVVPAKVVMMFCAGETTGRYRAARHTHATLDLLNETTGRHHTKPAAQFTLEVHPRGR